MRADRASCAQGMLLRDSVPHVPVGALHCYLVTTKSMTVESCFLLPSLAQGFAEGHLLRTHQEGQLPSSTLHEPEIYQSESQARVEQFFLATLSGADLIDCGTTQLSVPSLTELLDYI